MRERRLNSAPKRWFSQAKARQGQAKAGKARGKREGSAKASPLGSPVFRVVQRAMLLLVLRHMTNAVFVLKNAKVLRKMVVDAAEVRLLLISYQEYHMLF